MARPRIFISSTFYDLKQLRTDIERFVRDLGYDPILHERGRIAYGSNDKLEEYCYREIQHVDILVSIIGGRYGSLSSLPPYSVSQQELRTAYELGIQVFVFVDQSVLSEYQTFLRNKDLPGIAYSFVDNPAIYQFIEELHGLPNNNPITGFSSAQEIFGFLREQWAGMFQRFLQAQNRQNEARLVRDLQANMQTLGQLIEYLTTEKQSSNEAIREILRSNHPIFSQLQGLLRVTYRVYFLNRSELSRWLNARSFVEVERSNWDNPTVEEWSKDEKDGQTYTLLGIATNVFDANGELVIFTPQQWSQDWVFVSVREHRSGASIDDDEVPF